MSDAEVAVPSRGLGWWPTLVLWTAVIAFAALYLGSVRRQAEAPRAPVRVPTPAAQIPSQGPAPPAAPERGPSAEAPATAAPVVRQGTATQGSAGARPSQTSPESSAAIPSAPIPAAAPGPGAAAPAPNSAKTAAEVRPQPSVSGPAAPTDATPVRKAESAAFADTLIGQPQAPTTTPKPPVSTPTTGSSAPPPVQAPPSQSATPAAEAVPAGAQGDETLEAKREHVLSEYQAMQRAYWERMRGYRGNQDGGGGAPGYSYPGGYPGGYPGYGYGPYGIAPQSGR